jgi:hypothetical protein
MLRGESIDEGSADELARLIHGSAQQCLVGLHDDSIQVKYRDPVVVALREKGVQAASVESDDGGVRLSVGLSGTPSLIGRKRHESLSPTKG